jgi:LysR family transcriptional regulator of gallate degradation
VELSGPRSAERLSNQLTARAADHELSAFVGVATEGTVSAAARASRLSQPALNRSLRALENRLGVSLFHRTSGGMRLTPAGESLLRRTKLALAEIRQALEEVQALRGMKGGQIRIGALPLSRARLVPLAVDNLLRTYEAADIAIIDGTYESLVTALRLGDIDVLVGTIRRPAPVEGLVSEELFEDDIAVVVAADHPLASRHSVNLQDCVGWDWVLPFKNVPLRVQFEKMLDDAGLSRPQRVIESDSMVTVRTLLMSSQRLAILSRHQVHHEVGWGLLKVLPVRLKGVLRPVGITLRSDYAPTPLARALIAELRAVAAQIRAERPPCRKLTNPPRRKRPAV